MGEKIKYSPSSRRDLEEIGDYISKILGSPIAALNTVNKIQKTIERLNTFPLSGAPLSSVVDVNSDYRFLVCENYLAFYRAAENAVYIDRILYARRNYISILFGNPQDDSM
jgi:addiction module RelE/StbE family toxin